MGSCCGLLTEQRIRFIFFFSELILFTAAGMTVKFFPIFFNVACHFSPVAVQVVFASLSFLVAIGSLSTNKMAKRVGRMQVIIPCWLIGITCTLLLGSMRSLYTVAWVMIPLFLTRCTSTWSTGSLISSIMADYTPKAERARWKALDTVAAVGFSSSAALGGYLIDQYGYGLTFVLTGCFQATVMPLWILLTPVVAKESELLAAAEALETSDARKKAVSVALAEEA